MIGQSNVKGVAVGQVCQFVGREIRLLDYIEGVSQPLGFYATELRRRGWKDAVINLPHDGVAHNNISGKRYIDHWIEAGFECADPIKNTGAGAAMMRIEAARRIFRVAGSTRRRLRPDAMPLAITMSARTRTATSAWGRSMTGLLTPRTPLAISPSRTKNRRRARVG